MTRILALAASASVLTLAACQATTSDAELEPAIAPTPPPAEAAAPPAEPAEAPAEEADGFDGEALAAVLAAQPEAVQARYGARNPAETLEFFGVAPGMTVMEGLPGGGWYSKILLPYLGPEGKLVGVHYPDDIWARFGFFDEEGVAGRIEATANWPQTAADWEVENAAKVGSTIFTEIPEEMNGKVDAVILIRALHTLARFDAEAGYIEPTMAGLFRALKPGGVVGVVQHRAPADNPDEWANGSAGYLKQDAVVAAFEAAGFVLEEASEINANPNDTPSAEDVVWRLPPSLAGTEEGTPERDSMVAIGESDRMTLRFRKPA